jgi:sigma-E factor negative regulatory protein RseA
VTQEQVESQLSAMFDGELPAAECELLSRRLDRDENLRARWSRYALIGAAMRSEPVATARQGFAGRVSAALQAGDGSGRRHQVQVRPGVRKRSVWNAALAASMVAAVAGVSISMLRYSSPYVAAVPGRQINHSAMNQSAMNMKAASLASSLPAAAASAVMPIAMRVVSGKAAVEPHSYTTPVNQSGADMGLRTQLADFIVAHSEYSTPLMRRSLLSALVSSEEGGDSYAAHPRAVSAGPIDASTAASPASH